MKNASQRNLVGQNQKCTTRKPNANLRKNSTLYFQLGLIIALLLSIFMLEYRSPVTAHDFEKLSVEEENFKEWNETFRMIPEQAQSISKQVASSKILPPQEVPDETEIVEIKDIVPSKTSTSTTEIDVEDIEYIEKEEKIEEVSLEAVEFVPIYPGCENLETNLARKNCFQENLKELITRNFDSQRMQPYAVSGINRISVQFTVDETGHITNIKTRAANPQLEKEAQRVINKIPTMQPGVKNGKKVKVFYGQPILFKLDN